MTANTAKPRFKLSNKAKGLLLGSPVFIVIAAVILIPELWAAVMSFTRYSPGRSMTWIGLDNYREVLSDPNFWNAASNTLVFVVITVALQLCLALGFAALLSRGFRWQRLWIAAVLVPAAMSPAVLGTSWKYLFDRSGPINYLLMQIGIDPPSWFADPFFATVAVVTAYTWNHVPQAFIFVYPAMISVPEDLYDAASLDGATGWRQFRHITLPMIKGPILVALIFRTIIALRAFGEVYVLTRGGPSRATETLAIYLYREGFQFFNWGGAAAIGWLMLLMTVILVSPQMKQLARRSLAP